MEKIVTFAQSIPLRKHDAWGLKRADGKPYIKFIPADLDRRYDEAFFDVYHTR
jgi:hypothetical protein